MDNWRMDESQEESDNDSMLPMGRRHLVKLAGLVMLGALGGCAHRKRPLPQVSSRMPMPAPPRMPVPPLYFDGHYAHATHYHPVVLQRVVIAGNELVDKPYEKRGGHMALFDNGFDCSGSVSHVLFRAGLLDRPLTSAAFGSYGVAGPGNCITVYAKPGHHVFLAVCGLRFDTSGGPPGQGPRWRANPRSYEGFMLRHPQGW